MFYNNYHCNKDVQLQWCSYIPKETGSYFNYDAYSHGTVCRTWTYNYLIWTKFNLVVSTMNYIEVRWRTFAIYQEEIKWNYKVLKIKADTQQKYQTPWPNGLG